MVSAWKKFVFLAVLLFLFCQSAAADEKLTITTYYPSPNGSYADLYVSDKLGIGTTTPEYPLQVKLPSGGTIGYKITTNDYVNGTTGTYATLSFTSASGNTSARMQVGNAGGGSAGIFVLNPSGGNIGIGITGPTHLLHLNGGAYCDGTGDWIAGSDRAYKKDIDYNFKYGLKAVEQLKPVYYVHKKDKSNKRQIGFIAQDVKKIIPEVVSGEEGTYGLSYGQLTAVLVNAIKEQQQEIETLKAQIAELKKAPRP